MAEKILRVVDNNDQAIVEPTAQSMAQPEEVSEITWMIKDKIAEQVATGDISDGPKQVYERYYA